MARIQVPVRKAGGKRELRKSMCLLGNLAKIDFDVNGCEKTLNNTCLAF